MRTAQKIYHIFLHVLLLAVYFAFFAVQLFFNFEAFSSQQVWRNFSAFRGAAGREAKITVKRSTHSSGKAMIRLNKHFQLEEMLPCETTSIPAPEKYLSLKSPGSYQNVFLLNVFATNRPLRGPPQV